MGVYSTLYINDYFLNCLSAFPNWSNPSIYNQQGDKLTYLILVYYKKTHTHHRPAEASRAIRKKLKHGDSRRQYRALVVGLLVLHLSILSSFTSF